MKHLKFLPISLIGLIVLLALPALTFAHPLDQYVLSSYLTVAPDQITVEVDMTPGVLLVPQFLPTLDTNNDQQISDAESRTYAEFVLKNIELRVDGQLQKLSFTKIDIPDYLTIQAGYGTLRLYANAVISKGAAGETHQIYYKNNYQPTNPAYQINAFLDDTIPVKIGPQNRDAIQQSMTMDYTITAVPSALATPAATTPKPTTSASTAPTTQAVSGNSQQLQDVFNFLYEPNLSPWLWLAALGLSVLLGGLHALTPGHGKTLVAAYLVGSRGTTRDAIVLGGIVTFTHTISVIGIGLMALFASQFIVPALLVPTLELVAGLLVVGLGVRLLLTRWQARRQPATGHSHPHTHKLEPKRIGLGGLVAMGVSGGLVPCPEALGILLIAIGLNRLWLGLGLIVAFSLGVAVVLIAIGVLLVRSGRLLERIGARGKRWQTWLPILSAVGVTLLGIGMAVNSLVSYGANAGVVAVGLALGLVALALVGYWLARRRSQPVQALPSEPQSQPKRAVSNAPMGSAPMVYTPDGSVAWDEMWTDFCDLALAGGPPHRGTLLEPVRVEEVQNDPAGYERVVGELRRGLRLVSGLEVTIATPPGWIGLACQNEAMAAWLLKAIIVENVAVRREGSLLLLPAGPNFRLEKEIKNVITVVAKTHHYWTEHNYEASRLSYSAGRND